MEPEDQALGKEGAEMKDWIKEVVGPFVVTIVVMALFYFVLLMAE